MKRQLTTECDHEKDHQNDAISQRTPMRDTCNQSVKRSRAAMWHWAAGWENVVWRWGGGKADAAKKGSSKRGMRFKTQERKLQELLSSKA